MCRHGLLPALLVVCALGLVGRVEAGTTPDAPSLWGLDEPIAVACGLLIVFTGAAVYFLPTILASRRKHDQRDAIFALNLLAGWSGIGWLIAVMWALSARGVALRTAAPGPAVRSRHSFARP